MSKVTYRIWFEPAGNGAPYFVPDPADPRQPPRLLEFHERAAAETLLESKKYNRRNEGAPNYNPCWNGVFSVVPFFHDKPVESE